MINLQCGTLIQICCIFIESITLTECQAALGMESGVITDGQITASSENGNTQVAAHGRLHFQKGSGVAGAWGAGTLDVHQWLQVDLSSQYAKVTRVATQGRDAGSGTNQWVTMYKLQYGNNGVHFRYYREEGQTTNKVKLEPVCIFVHIGAYIRLSTFAHK